MVSNTIHNLTIELSIPTNGIDNPSKQSESIYKECFEETIKKVIEHYGEQYDLSISNIDLDLGLLSKEDIPQALENALCNELEKHINTKRQNSFFEKVPTLPAYINNNVTDSGNQIETFVEFLNTGITPWNIEPGMFHPQTYISENIALLEQREALNYFYNKLKNNIVALTRLNQLATPQQLKEINEKLMVHKSADLHNDNGQLTFFNAKELEKNSIYTSSTPSQQRSFDNPVENIEPNTGRWDKEVETSASMKNELGKHHTEIHNRSIAYSDFTNSENENVAQFTNENTSSVEVNDLYGNSNVVGLKQETTQTDFVKTKSEHPYSQIQESGNGTAEETEIYHLIQDEHHPSGKGVEGFQKDEDKVFAIKNEQIFQAGTHTEASKYKEEETDIFPVLESTGNSNHPSHNVNELLALSNEQVSGHLEQLFTKAQKFSDYTTLKENRIHTESAGLVILNPFLLSFFQRLDFLNEENQFKTAVEAVRAVHLLAYLAGTDTEEVYNNYPLEKVLCGLDTNFPIGGEFKILPNEKEEAENLLNTVCQRWKPLNNTSIEGLRLSFLQRHGTIEYDEGTILIRVEGKTLDILMDDLPWGTSMFLLPWVKPMFYVEWQPAE